MPQVTVYSGAYAPIAADALLLRDGGPVTGAVPLLQAEHLGETIGGSGWFLSSLTGVQVAQFTKATRPFFDVAASAVDQAMVRGRLVIADQSYAANLSSPIVQVPVAGRFYVIAAVVSGTVTLNVRSSANADLSSSTVRLTLSPAAAAIERQDVAVTEAYWRVDATITGSARFIVAIGTGTPGATPFSPTLPLSALLFTFGVIAGPGSAPTVVVQAGTGINAGVHQYAYTNVSPSGETTPSPIASVTHDAGFMIADPPSAPTAAAQVGSGVTIGDHTYAVTFVGGDGPGETLPGPTTTLTWPVVAAPIGNGRQTGTTGGSLTAGSWYGYKLTFVNASGETNCTVGSTRTQLGGAQNAFAMDLMHTSSDASVTSRKLYRTTAQASSAAAAAATHFLCLTIANNDPDGSPGTRPTDTLADGSLGAAIPTTNTATPPRQVALTNIPIGGTGTTSRKLYRTAVGSGALKLLTTIADNSGTSFTDTIADASLGAAPPTGSTAVVGALQQTAVSAIAAGPAGTTARKLYRTISGGSQLKLLTTIAGNTTTTHTDSTSDVDLGANAP